MTKEARDIASFSPEELQTSFNSKENLMKAGYGLMVAGMAVGGIGVVETVPESHELVGAGLIGASLTMAVVGDAVYFRAMRESIKTQVELKKRGFSVEGIPWFRKVTKLSP